MPKFYFTYGTHPAYPFRDGWTEIEALGGEVFALFLPVLYWMVARVVRDTLDARGGKDTWQKRIR